MGMSPAMFYLVVGVLLIGAELIIMQFSVFWFFFFGIGALIAALVGWVMPELSWTWAHAVFFLASVGTAALLFPPLRRWQAKPSPIAGHDAIGQTVEVIEVVSESSEGKVLWSGSDWPARLADGETELAVGEHGVIKKLEGIRLIVAKR